MQPGARVWVTRAEPGATATAGQLIARGFNPVVTPLLKIHALPDALIGVDLSPFTALAFTSRNGVETFAGLCPRRDWPVFAVGDATAQAARAAGFMDVRSAKGDAIALAKLIAADTLTQAGVVLAPGATEPAADLAALLEGRVTVRTVAVYQALDTGVAAPADFDAALIHSPRAARILSRLLTPDQTANRLAVAISSVAAAPLIGMGWTEVRTAAAPTDPDMLDVLGNPRRRV